MSWGGLVIGVEEDSRWLCVIMEDRVMRGRSAQGKQRNWSKRNRNSSELELLSLGSCLLQCRGPWREQRSHVNAISNRMLSTSNSGAKNRYELTGRAT